MHFKEMDDLSIRYMIVYGSMSPGNREDALNELLKRERERGAAANQVTNQSLTVLQRACVNVSAQFFRFKGLTPSVYLVHPDSMKRIAEASGYRPT